MNEPTVRQLLEKQLQTLFEKSKHEPNFELCKLSEAMIEIVEQLSYCLSE